MLEKPFRRIDLKDETYLKNLILYIHKNPIQHGFVQKLADYPWSSYFSIISDKKSSIEKDKVLYQFDTKENFIDSHQQKTDIIAVEKWLNIKVV